MPVFDRKRHGFGLIHKVPEQALTFRFFHSLSKRHLKVFQKYLFPQVPFGAVPPDGRFQIPTGCGGRLHLPEAVFQLLIVIPDAEKIHQQPERLVTLIILHLDANAHEGLADLVEGLATALVGLDVALLPEILKLAGNGLRGGKESLGDLLDRHGAFGSAQILDDFSLHRRQPADALLIVRREFIHHLHERLQKRIHAVTGDELR